MGVAAPKEWTVPVTEVPLNHWARLVSCLDAHRATVEMLREAARTCGDELPATAALFEEWRDIEVMHCERLRALIARADPQALN